MKNRMGLRTNHAELVIELMRTTNCSLGAAHIKDRLWDRWGRNTPTAREIGTFLRLHEAFIRITGRPAPRTGAEYIFNPDFEN